MMERKSLGVAALAAVLWLAGCGSGERDAQSGPARSLTWDPPAAEESVQPVVPPPPSASPPPPVVRLPEPVGTATPSPSPAPAPSPTPAPTPAKKPTRPASSAKERRDQQARMSAAAEKRKKQKSLSELVQMYPEHFVRKGQSASKRVALSFDDAPDEQYTPRVLDILQTYHVRATFFVVGYRAKEHPAIVKRILREGHVVGNHTYRHAYLPKLSMEKFMNEVESSEQVVADIAGYKPRLIRPPYGAINEEQVRWAAEHNYMIVNWDVDSEDWRGLSQAQIMRNVIGHVHAGSIILQHSGTGRGGDLSGTIEALPLIIQTLKQKGYEIVTIPELLNVSKQM